MLTDEKDMHETVLKRLRVIITPRAQRTPRGKREKKRFG